MRPETLLAYIRAMPFRPFRVTTNGGHVFDVRHPEMLRVGRDVFNYYYADPPDAPFDRWDTVSLLLVERVEHLCAPATAATGGNLDNS